MSDPIEVLGEQSLTLNRRGYHRVTPDRIERLLLALEHGFTRTAAAAVAGISRREFYRWLEEEGTDGTPVPGSPESETLTNRQRVEEAEALAQARVEGVILSALPKNTAEAWAWLRRRAAADWGPQRNETLELKVDYKQLTTEQLQRIANGEDVSAVLGR